MSLSTDPLRHAYRDAVYRVDLAPSALVDALRERSPGLGESPGALGLVLHLLLTEAVEPPGRTAPCPHALLGEIAGASASGIEHRNFRAEDFLDHVRAALEAGGGDRVGLVVSSPEPRLRQARRLRLDDVPADIADMAAEARLAVRVEPGEWVEVRPDGTFSLNHTAAARRRQDLMDSLPTYDNTPELSSALQGYLNGHDARTFAPLKREAGSDETVRLVESLYPRVEDRERVAATLRSVQLNPVPIYGPSPSTPRLHARGRNATSLPSAVRQDITRRLGWVELDLAHAQLACNAARWSVRSVLERLGADGYAFWDDLMVGLGADPDDLRRREAYSRFKSVLKRPVHGVSFGMAQKRVRRLGVEPGASLTADEAEAVEAACGAVPGEVGIRLVRHPVVADMLRARYRLQRRVVADGGLTDTFGRFLPLAEGQNPGALLAIDAQAMELRLLEPVIREAVAARRRFERQARARPPYSVVLWQHDGFTVRARDRARLPAVVRSLQRSVADRAAELGVPTALTVDVAPVGLTPGA